MTQDVEQTTTPPARPAVETRALSVQECWSHLRQQTRGRLTYLSGRGPRHVVLSYVVRDDELVVEVPPYNEAAQYARGRRVTFDVITRTGERSARRVDVAGLARVLGPGAVWDTGPAGHRPPDRPGRLVGLAVDEVCGRLEQVGVADRPR
ncbi:hypothetical protein [Microlunatus antarcticus]|uniref:Pyridoxamine 5'-phosphate oxidase n=1 Tax=Microlunatus antarcticus TaxID=53388 RepID=A0A7W5JW94_9ACTN|nr:hypothetical protein [Microlunatus antarcticus]MBB3327236.1 hypothetical protein [Microlunatus antarcticus]